MTSIKTTAFQTALVLLTAIAIGCGGAGPGKGGTTPKVTVNEDGDRLVSKETQKDFAAVARKIETISDDEWTDDTCKSIAKRWEKVAKGNDDLAEAQYNAGVAYLNCDMQSQSKKAFEKTVKDHPEHQLSLIQLAIMELEAGNESAAQTLLLKVIQAGGNKLEAVPAYVNAAKILRGRAINGEAGAFKKAQNNLRRALAIDSKYMPALYELALLYLDIARMQRRSSYLTLATLVCNQAIGLNPEYGPIYHALGLILLEKDELVNALKAFETAFQKDKRLFASYMNYGAINLEFRGYQEAKGAFEQANALNPKSYDAHIGLGVALRGLGDFEGATAEYNKAKAIDPKRTDYIFNIGVLKMDYTNSGDVAGFNTAQAVFENFVAKANKSHKKDPDGKRGPKKSWQEKAQKRVKLCEKNKALIKKAEKEMAEMERLNAENARRAAEMQEKMEKAKKLE
jgi:tetratricopeptide (TPR) repeat protein